MDVTADGRLIAADGVASSALFAIGPAARGALWEVTAVPDLRLQARRLGRLLAGASLQPETADFNPGNTAPTLACR